MNGYPEVKGNTGWKAGKGFRKNMLSVMEQKVVLAEWIEGVSARRGRRQGWFRFIVSHLLAFED